ncbi:hypothetical protein KDK82_3869 [Delftia sp. K82]|nr:hypothetical protein KDK82_3869 [Delftia sp. K82]
MVRAGPPDGVHLLARVAGGLRLAHGRGRHHAGRPQQHVVGALLADLQPGGLLLHAGRRHGQQGQVEAFLGSALLQQRNGFLAVGRVVVDQGDLLALEAALFLLEDVLDDGIGRCPVVAQQREVPLEDLAVGRLRQAIARGDDGHLVAGRLVRHGERDAGGLRIETGSAAALALQALIALHALGGVVGRLAFLVGDLHAIDAALGVDQLDVVLLAIGPWNAQRRELARAVDQQRHELVLGLCGRGGHESADSSSDRGGGDGDFLEHHDVVS